MKPTTGQIELAFGLLAGVAIAAVDRFALRGEVSPLVIIAMLLAAALLAGSLWGIRGWIAAIAMWVCVPGARSMEYALSRRDALEPNAFQSTVILAASTFAVTAIGFAIGLAIKRTGRRNTSTRS
jgi:NhaP-type Na+/H+ or K+/H+ antiporter